MAIDTGRPSRAKKGKIPPPDPAGPLAGPPMTFYKTKEAYEADRDAGYPRLSQLVQDALIEKGLAKKKS